MKKSELISHIAEKAQLSKKAAGTVLKTIIDGVHKTLKQSGEMRIAGLGTFRVIKRKARKGFNPQTKAKMTIPAMKTPGFRPAKALKEAATGGAMKSNRKK